MISNQDFCSSVFLCNPLLYSLDVQISLAELQSLLSELEGRSEGQAANIESLTSTLKTKDEIINVSIHLQTLVTAAALDKELFRQFSCFLYVCEQTLHQSLGQRGDSRADHTQDQVIGSGMERSLPGLPQRERTMIGGDSQQEVNQKFSAE